MLPIFFFAVMFFLYFFVAEAVNINIHREGLELARNVSLFGSLGDLSDTLREKLRGSLGEGASEETTDAVAGMLEDSLEERLIETYMAVITRGYGSFVKDLDCRGAGISADGRFMRVSVGFRFAMPIDMFGLFSAPVREDFRVRLFNGEGRELLEVRRQEEEEEEGDDEMVYVTESGTVYHVTMQCPSLNIRSHSVALAGIGGERNSSGAKYYPCEHCAGGTAPGTVLITEDGNRYHYTSGCPGLKRTVRKIPLKEAEKTYRPCKRCGAGH
ncbi:MAG: hypothetical protein ILP10_01680 [Lachnospiraceae bacterium]|nr:hypothetical protein [Lachnospiraceae bacterium]